MNFIVTQSLIATLTQSAGSSSLQSSSRVISNEHVITEVGVAGEMSQSLLMRVMTTSSTVMETDPRITLVSWLASKWSDDGYVAMRKNRQAYAQSHGYQFLDFNETNLPTPQLREGWQSLRHYIKPRLLLALMATQQTSDWIVWTDADTLYTNASIPWAKFLEPKADLIFAESPGVVCNDGVFAVRSTPWSQAFLQDWIHECDVNANQKKKTHLFDNGPFIHSILRAYAKTHNVSYNNECRPFIAKFDLDKQLDSCYHTHLRRVSNASGLRISRSPNGLEGSALVNDAHVLGAWGINSGLKFKQPNNWKPGDFLLHLAGQGKPDRLKNALRYSPYIGYIAL